ncbi:MAG: radical SAM family heme chaperone HemW [Desulfatiglandaceae bacterium]
MNENQSPGLYLHVPFCRSKCPYCSFYSVPSTKLVPRWLGALQMEAGLYRERFGRFDTIYLGGGTPTLLEVRVLEKIMDCLRAHFDFTPETEITIEANPYDLTPDKIRKLKTLGFNRISLGVQSFDDRTLSFLGRRHTALDAEKALGDLRAFGFENIGLDLIYGFNGQTMKDWTDTLTRAVSFQPEHLSCYQLTIEKGTHFHGRMDLGKIRPLSEKEGYAFFMRTSQFLEDHGYIHYEVSNFARMNTYISRHNRKYWHHTPYMGLGPCSHSFSESTRWWNVRSVRRYCEMIEGGSAPVEGLERLTDQQVLLESISLGSRTAGGFDLSLIPSNPHSSERLMRLQEDGFIRLSNGRVLPTRKGFLVADHLPLYLLD